MADAGMILDTWGAVFPGSPMTDVTRILSAIEEGDAQAAEKLLPLVYEELRKLAAAKMAQENLGQTLQATGLVHEAYLRLVGGKTDRIYRDRSHFFATAATAMRRILVDNARAKQSDKRGGRCRREPLVDMAAPPLDDELLTLNEALGKLAAEDSLKAQLVELRYFGGLTGDQAAEVLGISPSTADRHWAFARAWLQSEVRGC
jgi:RNA polymerase sigma factor (TIGR02999 family)